jgi:hypothetical protein
MLEYYCYNLGHPNSSKGVIIIDKKDPPPNQIRLKGDEKRKAKSE